MGETKFQLWEYPRSGSKAMNVERKKDKKLVIIMGSTYRLNQFFFSLNSFFTEADFWVFSCFLVPEVFDIQTYYLISEKNCVWEVTFPGYVAHLLFRFLKF